MPGISGGPSLYNTGNEITQCADNIYTVSSVTGGQSMLKQLTYLGHSCFRIEAENGWTGVMDPYQEGSVPGLKLPAIEADAVYCSHDHADHCGREAVTLRTSGPENPYRAETVLTDHDDRGGSLRGKNHVLILTCGEEKIVHLGDIGCIPEEAVLAPMKHADVLMIPCGGYYTIDAAQAKELIGMLEPKLAVLMHFRCGNRGYDVLSSQEEVCAVIPETVVTGKPAVKPGEYNGVIILEPCSR